MRISYLLRNPKSLVETAIYARICYHNNVVKYFPSVSVLPSNWNPKTGRIRESMSNLEHIHGNITLDRVEDAIRKVYAKFITETGNREPSKLEFKKSIEEMVNGKLLTSSHLLVFMENMIQDSIDGKRQNISTKRRISPSTIKTYVTIFKVLSEFQKKLGTTIEFSMIDMSFYHDLISYLETERGFSANYVGKHIQILKLVLTEANYQGINSNLNFKARRFMIPREESSNIYLNRDELDELAALDLSSKKKLDTARDLFLLAAYTGQRWSDVHKLNFGNIEIHKDERYFNIVQAKTNKRVMIPAYGEIDRLLAKYENGLPKPLSNQKMNQYLKVIGSLAPSLHNQVVKIITKGGKQQQASFKKFELLTTHTARRSYATNMYQDGVPIYSIMHVTGHTTEKSFRKYIKSESVELARMARGK